MKEERKRAREALERIIAAGFMHGNYGGSPGNILVGELYESGSITFHIGPEDWLHGFMWSHEGSWEYRIKKEIIGKIGYIYFSEGSVAIHFEENGRAFYYELHNDRRTLPEKGKDIFDSADFHRFTVNDVIRIAKKYAGSREIPPIGAGYSFINPLKFKGRLIWKKRGFEWKKK